jgi:hypothetical protein
MPFLAHESGRALLMLVCGPKRTSFLDSEYKNGSGMALPEAFPDPLPVITLPAIIPDFVQIPSFDPSLLMLHYTHLYTQELSRNIKTLVKRIWKDQRFISI